MCDMIDVASQDEFESHPVYKVLYLLRRQGVSLKCICIEIFDNFFIG